MKLQKWVELLKTYLNMAKITYVTDCTGHNLSYAINSTKLQKELGGREPNIQFEKGIENTVKRYPDNQEWLDNVTSGEVNNMSNV